MRFARFFWCKSHGNNYVALVFNSFPFFGPERDRTAELQGKLKQLKSLEEELKEVKTLKEELKKETGKKGK